MPQSPTGGGGSKPRLNAVLLDAGRVLQQGDRRYGREVICPSARPLGSNETLLATEPTNRSKGRPARLPDLAKSRIVRMVVRFRTPWPECALGFKGPV